MSTERLIASSFFAGLGATVALIAIVFATGSTFGQRCDRMFPDSALRAEACVQNLVKGNAP
jgi:hypothetical protein